MANSIGMAGLGFVFWVIATRYATETVVGQASAILSIIGLLVSLSSLGLGMAMIRFLPERDLKGRSQLINSTFILTSLVALFVGSFYILFLWLFTPKLSFLYSTPIILFGIVVLIMIRLISTLMNSIFISYRGAIYVFFKETVIFNLLKIVFIPFLIVLGVVGVLISWGLALLISLVVSIIVLIHEFKYRPSPSLNIKIIKPMFLFAGGNYVTGLLASLPSFLLPIFMINLLTAEDTAHFYVAWMIGSILFTLPGNICMSLFAEGSHDIKKFRHNIIKSINFILLITIPAIVVLLLFGNNILSIFGERYSSEGATLLRLLSLSTFPLIGVSIFITIKRVEKRTKEMMAVQGIIAVITIGFAYFLSPTYGIIGAGIGWIIALCTALIFILFLYLLNRFKKVRRRAHEDSPS
jgi:O-antigen/teichoic acid export membrane protein